MTTDKTIKSKYQPKQTNVTWVDLSGETPIEKHFINGRWRPIGGSGAGSTNPGYNVTRSFVTLDNESVTTIKEEGAPVSFGDFTNTIELKEGSTYIVVFDGVEYQCVARNEDSAIAIGCESNSPQPDFAEYPFAIATDEIGSFISTENPGTYQVEIKRQNIDSITVSDDFSAAVEYVNETLPSLKCATVVFNNDNDLTDGFKIYFQEECIYDTVKLSIRPKVTNDNVTLSTRITSGNRNSIPEELFNIDALLVEINGATYVFYKNSYDQDNINKYIEFLSMHTILTNNNVIIGSNSIYIYSTMIG